MLSLVDLVRAAPGAGVVVVVVVEDVLPPVSVRPPSSSDAADDELLLSVKRSRRGSVDGLIAPRLEEKGLIIVGLVQCRRTDLGIDG